MTISLAKAERKDWPDQSLPMMAGGNICTDVDGRHQGIAYGEIGSIHLMAKRTGLVDEINQQLERLQRQLQKYLIFPLHLQRD